MAAFVAWFIGAITGARAQPRSIQDSQGREELSEEPSKKEAKRTKGVKARQKVNKSSDEPKFNTELVTPIEDIIEETITEEIKSESLQNLPKKKGKSRNQSKKHKSEESDKIDRTHEQEVNEEDTIGYSFLKKKSPDTGNSEKISKKKLVKSNAAASADYYHNDDVGSSFFPVKEKGRKNRNKAAPEKQAIKNSETLDTLLAEQTFKKTKDSSKPSIIDHYNKKGTKDTISTPVNTKLHFEIQKSEFKQSKLVTSTLSYASILTNSIEKQVELDPVIKSNNKDECQLINSLESDKVTKDVLNTPNFNFETLQIADIKVDATKSESDLNFQPHILDKVVNDNSPIYDNQAHANIEVFEVHEPENFVKENKKISKSNSSSIEIISEIYEDIQFEQNNCQDAKESEGIKAEPTPFEVIEENINRIVDLDSNFDQFDGILINSDESSISVTDSQIGRENIPTVVDKNVLINGNSPQNYFEDSELTNILLKVSDKLNLLEETKEEQLNKNTPENIDFNVTSSETSNYVDNFFTTSEEKLLHKESIVNSQLFEEALSETTADYLPSETDNNSKLIEDSCSVEYLQVNGSKASECYTDLVNTNILEPEKDETLSDYFIDDTVNDSISIHEVKQSNTIILQSLTDNFEEELSEPVIEETIIKEVTCPTETPIISTESNVLGEYSEPVIEDTIIKEFSCPTETPTISTESDVLEEITVNTLPTKLNMTTAQQIRVLTLNDQEHQECTLYRIQKDWIVQFRLGPSLFGRKVYLYCNYPIEKAAEFNRKQYRLLNWTLDEGCKNADDTAAYAQVVAKLAGSFHYYFTYENGDNAKRDGSGFFLVDPILKYGNDEDLLLDCIQCQTVLAKNLGSFSSWEKKLRVAKESGYNMIHFSPIQELGVSNSGYSISEQLEFNPVFKKENGDMPQFQEIKQFMSKIRREWKVTSICDIVLNHTANESVWIKKHPEVTYNCINCPYMRPAYLLDAAFHQFSIDVKRGLYEDRGIPPEINTEDHLNAIRYHFNASILDPLRLQELFICDVNNLVGQFLSNARTTTPVTPDFRKQLKELELVQDPEYKRLGGIVDMKLAQQIYNVYWNDTFDEESRLKKCAEEFKNKLDSLNNAITEKIKAHLIAAVDNVIAGIRYFRVQPDGPKLKDITAKNPLVYRYFTDYGSPKSIKEHEEIMYSSNGQFLMAHNGWVMDSDPLKNFGSPDSNVYIRRELIAWGDSVKLRYGDKPEDCPFLWEYMRQYVEQTATIFDGVRLDNCHSTPIPVAEYLIDCARKIKPDLYVVAELFTNSDLTDNIFVNRLGITSLIREAMSAWDSHEEGRLVYRYGGNPVGSFYQPRIRPLVPSIAHALFLDLTHDNPSPVDKRSVFDLLPSTALVNMACCASGSNRGYDELVPHHIHVVDESRQYTEWTEDENLAAENVRYVTNKSGIVAAKKAINDIHFTLGKEGYSQVYVDQMDPDIVAVTRHRPDSHHSYILVAFTAFGYPNEDAGTHQRGIKPLRVEGDLEEVVLEATLSHVSHKTGGSKFAKWEKYVNDPKWINGLSEYQVSLKQHIDVNESDILERVYSGTPNVTQLNFKNFKPGSIVVIKVSLPEIMNKSVKDVRTLIGSIACNKELAQVINKLTLPDLNRVLFRCDQEERDEGFGFGTYSIPNFESTVYAGLQGFVSLLANIRPNNDLGHPMCANLRDGNWMIEYIWKRLKLDEGTRDLGVWIEKNTECFNNIPRYLVPSYFDSIVTGIYILLIEHCDKLMSTFVNHGSTFVRGLSLGSVQFAAYIKSADLPTLSPNLAPPKPPTRKNEKGETVQACVTLSAGLPHFSVGYMRNWGRDTFIALRGLFLLTGRFEEARQHILGYGACLRHGLIPNLLDGGRNSRFNCRDAVWWWLYCIKEYAEEAPNGLNILNDKVSRIFPTDDSAAQPAGAVDQPLTDIIQEALSVHFQGLAFRERNAGQQIDAHMTDRGFNNRIGIHPETGFVFGGNEWNCGTWMDKMGSSDKAGNRGKPATPRDGSAIELIGLSKAVITWLARISEEKKYPFSGVERTHKNGSITMWSFKEWSEKIQANFEKYFWINTYPVPNEIKQNLINKRGIYKDCYGATQDWTDFQLRCNFPIAMVVAPELFTPQQAWTALNQAEKHLLGPLGMKTLDPSDWAYRGDYDNSNDSDDPTVAHGFNYHQGPEWVWPLGYFLRAKLQFASPNGALKETVASTKLILSKHFVELQTSPWRGLPELTNSNGSYCRDSSRTQAWSMSCVLEVLRDLQKIDSSQSIRN